jgi:hypothetical protein
MMDLLYDFANFSMNFAKCTVYVLTRYRFPVARQTLSVDDRARNAVFIDVSKHDRDDPLILLYGVQGQINESLLSQEVWTQQNEENITLLDIFVIPWLNNAMPLPF